MFKIRSKNTKIEISVMNILSSEGTRFRQHPRIHGSLDFLIGCRIAVFCDADFLHGYRLLIRNPQKKNGEAR